MKVRSILLTGLLSLTALFLIYQMKTDPAQPIGMILIPAGEFIMGTDEIVPSVQPIALLPTQPNVVDASPAHTLYLDSFYIDRLKVTRREYGAFAKSTGRALPSDLTKGGLDQPVSEVTWLEAGEYCRWAKKRLPTEEEWEKAARGPNGLRYPWGNDFNPSAKQISNAPPADSILSPYGAEAMIGFGWEWTADWYRPYPNNTYRVNAFFEGNRVIRGGSWRGQSDGAASLLFRTTTRFYSNPETRSGQIGFRCAQSS